MTDHQMQLIETSFAKIAPNADAVAAAFYDTLFTLDPSLRPLFRGDMQEQGRKLMQTLGIVVNSLRRLESIVPAVRTLGQKHAGYGVQDEHYSTVGTALLMTLEAGLGAEFTPELHNAWASAYTILADTMRAAAAETPPYSPRDLLRTGAHG